MASAFTNLLVIEDDAPTRANLHDILALDGYEVRSVAIFGDALAILQRDSSADIWGIILDRKLPDGSAETLLPQLRALAAHAAIIIITGYHDLEGAIACLRQGADDYILKPLNPDALRASVARLREHRLARSMLRATEERLRIALKNAPIIIANVDRDLRYTWVHSAVEHFRPERIIGRRDDELIASAAEAQSAMDLKREVLRSGAGLRREVATTFGDTPRIFDVTAEPMRADDGAIVGVTLAMLDITERKRNEERLRNADRLASIGTLAAGLGHDMHNVLLPVRARLDVLDRTDLPAPVREHLVAVRRSIAYLQQLSDGLHLLALNPDDDAASGASTDVGEWWSQVGSLLRKALPKHVNFRSDLQPNLPAVAVPPHRLTQAILNLVVNAGEAIPAPRKDGEVTIAAMLDSDERSLRLSVSDNGDGMSPEVRRRALEPFFTTKKRGLGTGLGLSLVHGVAQASGGSITIDSAPKRGTTISLILPLASREATATGEERGTSESLGARQAAITMSDRRAASFIASMLVGMGYEVVHRKEAPMKHEVQAWVAEPSCVVPHQAKQFLDADSGRRLVLVGAAWPGFSDGRVGIINDPTSMDEIRRVLGEAFAPVRPT